MVAYHDRLKKCVDRDIPLWLSRYREKFRSPVPEGEAIPVSPANFLRPESYRSAAREVILRLLH